MDRESICDSRMGISWIFNVASLSSVSLTSCICKGPFHHLCQLHLRITNRGYAAFPFAWNCLVSDGWHMEEKALNISHGYVCFGKKWVSISHWITFAIIRVSLSIMAATLMASLCYSNRKQQMPRAPIWTRGNGETEITTSSFHLTHLLPELILQGIIRGLFWREAWMSLTTSVRKKRPHSFALRKTTTRRTRSNLTAPLLKQRTVGKVADVFRESRSWLCNIYAGVRRRCSLQWRVRTRSREMQFVFFVFFPPIVSAKTRHEKWIKHTQ